MEQANDAELRVRPPTATPSSIPVEGDLVVRAKFDASVDERLPLPGVLVQPFLRCARWVHLRSLTAPNRELVLTEHGDSFLSRRRFLMVLLKSRPFGDHNRVAAGRSKFFNGRANGGQ